MSESIEPFLFPGTLTFITSIPKENAGGFVRPSPETSVMRELSCAILYAIGGVVCCWLAWMIEFFICIPLEMGCFYLRTRYGFPSGVLENLKLEGWIPWSIRSFRMRR